MKKILALMLSLALILTLAVPALAEGSVSDDSQTPSSVSDADQGDGAEGGNGGSEGGNDGSEGGNGGSEGGNDGSEGGNGGSEGGNGGSEGGNGGSEGGNGGAEGGNGGSEGGNGGSEGGNGGSEGGEGGSEGGSEGGEGGSEGGSGGAEEKPGNGCKHKWDGGSVTVKATCKEEGAIAYLCSLCGDVLVEVVPKLTTHTYDNACDTTCNVCEATREAEHKFSTSWSKNSREHWYACTLCGEKKDIGGHFPGPAATEERDQLCLTCGLLMTPKLTHSHKYDSKWTSDETGHWHACEGCEEKGEFKAHTYDDACDADCNVCGYVTETAHSFDGEWVTDESSHWYVCSVCGEKGNVVEHMASSDVEEGAAKVCIICGYEMAPAADHVHQAEEAWLTDENGHWHECECGEKMDAAFHAWDEGTEEEDGTVTYVCEECQAEKTEGEPETQEEEQGGFPWWILLLVIAVICGGAAIGLIVFMGGKKKGGKFSR